jgi:hypothetical protein
LNIIKFIYFQPDYFILQQQQEMTQTPRLVKEYFLRFIAYSSRSSINFLLNHDEPNPNEQPKITVPPTSVNYPNVYWIMETTTSATQPVAPRSNYCIRGTLAFNYNPNPNPVQKITKRLKGACGFHQKRHQRCPMECEKRQICINK